ncbi:ornithine--oxo-acid transaminase [Methylocaldum sp.]|uniref:ornithine--oxo-acid transaminase n=1 Tax=Methylocaldum sp. TaxID=1969727 RepID=UPI002D5BAD82|nr:ornithine--oxo-acid transaminase [Methylocaldum sp.]HYE37982.1 ornithine--oxo-acid transaminase [Methylocaldum sp.]
MTDIPLVKPIRLIGVAFDRDAETGPELLRGLGLDRRLKSRGVPAAWQTILHPQRMSATVPMVAELCERTARETEAAVRSGEFFAVFGDDHSCAVGSWAGAVAALSDRGPLGLIWIDAHMDSHVPETSPSGALHGMPLACLLGFGEKPLVDLGGFSPKLSPRQVCLVGVHSFEAAERALLEWLGVRIFYLDEVNRRGLNDVMDEALSIVQSGTAGFGVTLDLDAIDPKDAPGVTVPVAGGISGEDMIGALARLQGNPAFLGIEIVEFDPPRDKNRATTYLGSELLLAAVVPKRATRAEDILSVTERYGANNYDTFPVILTRGEGVYFWDIDGKRYLDMMGAYSAASHGHAHPRLIRTFTEQAKRLAITSRAFHSDRLAPFFKRLCELTGQDKVLPMNTGAEGVETALKAARKWAYQIKGVSPERAEIIGCRGNFHGRTLAVIGLSSEPKYREGFGPFPPGLKLIPYGDAAALADAINENTAAFLVEPIQGEGGIVIPSPGYLAECAEVCREQNVLLLCDEVQTGLGRTGKFLASEHENVTPDGLILGKALGGGLMPVSAFLASREVMDVFGPGDHGSTFGGNPLAAAVGLEALDVIVEEGLAERSAELGAYFLARLRDLRSPLIREARGKGLFIGLELNPDISGRDFCMKLMEHGILTRETRRTVIRFAPPLVIERKEIDWVVEKIAITLRGLERG